MKQPTRRTLLTAAAAAISTSASRVLGANSRPRLAIVGVGGRGTDHVQTYAKLPECEIAAVVDVNQAAQERAVALVKKLTGREAKAYTDMREAFADPSIDGVSIATPNHWHVLASMWAVQAGKDVYVEKPVSHNIWEGWQLAKAARAKGRIVQVGMQSRSMPHKQKATRLLQEGVIGKVYLAKGLCFKRRKSIGHTPDQPVPAGINWDIFLGPAPMRPFSMNRFKYNWHWFWDTGNGDIGNQGVHEMDIALWGLGKKTMPKSVYSSGGKFAYVDDQETPNTQRVTFDFGDSQVVFDVRGLFTGEEGGVPRQGGNVIGDLFYGTEGWMMVHESGFKVYKGEDNKLAMDEKPSGAEYDTAPHMANFLKAMKSRRHQDLNADIETGALAAAMCHLGNISYRTGRKLTWDAEGNRFAGDAEASALLTREYRKPYVVPAV